MITLEYIDMLGIDRRKHGNQKVKKSFYNIVNDYYNCNNAK